MTGDSLTSSCTWSACTLLRVDISVQGSVMTGSDVEVYTEWSKGGPELELESGPPSLLPSNYIKSPVEYFY